MFREQRVFFRARDIFLVRRNRMLLRGDWRRKLRQRQLRCADQQPRIAARFPRPWILPARRYGAVPREGDWEGAPTFAGPSLQPVRVSISLIEVARRRSGRLLTGLIRR